MNRRETFRYFCAPANTFEMNSQVNLSVQLQKNLNKSLILNTENIFFVNLIHKNIPKRGFLATKTNRLYLDVFFILYRRGVPVHLVQENKKAPKVDSHK